MVAEISKKQISSAPKLLYCFACSTGSPASFKLIKFIPLPFFHYVHLNMVLLLWKALDFCSFNFCKASENVNFLSYNALPIITPSTPFENSLLNLEISFNEETPPEAITECGIDFANLTVFLSLHLLNYHL